MITLQEIKDEYYMELSMGNIMRMSLEEYIRQNYYRVYDDNMNFIGWEKI